MECSPQLVAIVFSHCSSFTEEINYCVKFSHTDVNKDIEVADVPIPSFVN